MNKTLALCICIAFLLCACGESKPAQTAGTTASTTLPDPTDITENTITEPTVTFESPFVALSMPISKVEALAQDGELLYTYTSQSFSLILPDPDAAQLIMNDFSNRADSAGNAARMVHEAANSDYSGQEGWIPYVYSELYAPARLDQSILSLFGSEIVFDGSSRSATVDLSLTYDLLTGNILDEISQILVDDYSADSLCDLIYAQLASLAEDDILFADYAYIISDMFTTNTPVTNWYFSRNGICFYFMPYEIAPHSAGTIVAEVPYSSLVGLLQDRYFPAEAVDMNGKPLLSRYVPDASYAQMAELELEENAEKYVLYAEGALFDVTIAQKYADGTENKPVFAAASLCSGDAIVIHCSDEQIKDLVLTYRANGEYVSTPLCDSFS